MAVVLVVAAPGGDPGGGIRSPHVAAQRPSSIRSAPPRCGAARHGQTLGGGGGRRRRRGIPLPTRAQGGPVPWIAATRIRDRECVADLEASTAARRRRKRDRDRGGRREEARREGISLSSLSVSRESRRREGDARGGCGSGRTGPDRTGRVMLGRVAKVVRRKARVMLRLRLQTRSRRPDHLCWSNTLVASFFD